MYLKCFKSKIHRRIPTATYSFYRLKSVYLVIMVSASSPNFLCTTLYASGPTLPCASETQSTYRKHLKALERVHQRCSRDILGICWEERRTNASVLLQENTISIEAMVILFQFSLFRLPFDRTSPILGMHNIKNKQRYRIPLFGSFPLNVLSIYLQFRVIFLIYIYPACSEDILLPCKLDHAKLGASAQREAP